MKKVKNLLIAVLFLIISITTVNAKNDIFELGWGKDLITDGSILEVGYSKKIQYKDGYVVSNITSFSEDADTKITYYNNNGDVVKEKILSDKNIISIKEYKGNIYAVSSWVMSGADSDVYLTANIEQEWELLKLNEDLEIIETAKYVFYDSELFFVPFLVNNIGIDYISTVDDKITVLGAHGGTLALNHFDVDLKNQEEKMLSFTEENVKEVAKYYPIVSEYLKLMEENDGNAPQKISILSETKNNLKVYNGADLSKCGMFNYEIDANDPCYINSTMKLTSDNNVVFEKNYEDYILLIDAKIIGNHIVAIGVKNVGDIINLITEIGNEEEKIDINSLLKTEVVVLNMAGEIVQTINDEDSLYLGITPSSEGFAVNKLAIDLSVFEDTKVEDILLERPTNYSVEIYNLKVEEPSIPEVPENPETKDIALIGVGIALLLGLGLTLFNYKKINSLR